MIQHPQERYQNLYCGTSQPLPVQSGITRNILTFNTTLYSLPKELLIFLNAYGVNTHFFRCKHWIKTSGSWVEYRSAFRTVPFKKPFIKFCWFLGRVITFSFLVWNLNNRFDTTLTSSIFIIGLFDFSIYTTSCLSNLTSYSNSIVKDSPVTFRYLPIYTIIFILLCQV